MERSEPALVPEWLRNSGSVAGGGNSTHHSALSSSYRDVPSSAYLARNGSSDHRGDAKSPSLSRSSSSSFWRNSSNGSAKHAYSNFSRHRDKDCDRERDNLRYLDPWERDPYDPLDSILNSRDKDGLRRSQSMVSRKQVEIFPSKDLNKGGNNGTNRNGILSVPNKTGIGMHKSVLNEDFPSLGCGERQGAFETSRASSPGLVSAVQSLPIGNSVLIGGEGWSSALVEVPNVDGSSNTRSLSSPKTVGSVQTRTGDVGAMHGLNMAEALTQVPSRARTPPQLSVQTQRLEELAVKQSRQLIPVIPSSAKASVLGSFDKYKNKPAVRSGEMSTVTLRSTHTSQSPSGGAIKSDSFKTTQGGKLHVLKPSWENGVNSSQKHVPSNANGGSSNNDPVPLPQSITVPPDRALKNPTLNMAPGVTLEKKQSLSHTKSRNEFFKLLKQKNSVNMSSDPVSATEKQFVSKEALSIPETPHGGVNSGDVTNYGDASNEKNRCVESAWKPNDEEIAFLRSLGWVENHGEDEGLTKEEIEAFYNEYDKSKPTLKVCRGFSPTLTKTRD